MNVLFCFFLNVTMADLYLKARGYRKTNGTLNLFISINRINQLKDHQEVKPGNGTFLSLSLKVRRHFVSWPWGKENRKRRSRNPDVLFRFRQGCLFVNIWCKECKIHLLHLLFFLIKSRVDRYFVEITGKSRVADDNFVGFDTTLQLLCKTLTEPLIKIVYINYILVNTRWCSYIFWFVL